MHLGQGRAGRQHAALQACQSSHHARALYPTRGRGCSPVRPAASRLAASSSVTPYMSWGSSRSLKWDFRLQMGGCGGGGGVGVRGGGGRAVSKVIGCRGERVGVGGVHGRLWGAEGGVGVGGHGPLRGAQFHLPCRTSSPSLPFDSSLSFFPPAPLTQRRAWALAGWRGAAALRRWAGRSRGWGCGAAGGWGGGCEWDWARLRKGRKKPRLGMWSCRGGGGARKGWRGKGGCSCPTQPAGPPASCSSSSSSGGSNSGGSGSGSSGSGSSSVDPR